MVIFIVRSILSVLSVSSSLSVLSWGIVVYYESIKREVTTRPMCRCDERLKTKDEESTRLTYTGLLGEIFDVRHSVCVYLQKNKKG